MAAVESGTGFVATYPPFSYWTGEAVVGADRALDAAPDLGTPLGVYAHIPFCRQRCRFCFYRVDVGANAARVHAYLTALRAEAQMYGRRRAIQGRQVAFVYLGGGTPTFLNARQLKRLFSTIHRTFDVAPTAEISVECDPATLTPARLEALCDGGVTRVSLGVESWEGSLMADHGRDRRADTAQRALEWCRDAGLQVNIDLLTGLVGETDDHWRRTVARTVELEPGSVTVYQMDVPRNTALYSEIATGGDLGGPLPDVTTRRRRATEAIHALRRAGYHLTSAYTAVRDAASFRYRDLLWRGADMVGLGVASFGKFGRLHLQNTKHLEDYVQRISEGSFPLHRGYAMDEREQMRRLFILQLKFGHVDLGAFRARFGACAVTPLREPLATLSQQGLMTLQGSEVRLTDAGLAQVDALLPAFYLPQHGGPPAGRRP